MSDRMGTQRFGAALLAASLLVACDAPPQTAPTSLAQAAALTADPQATSAESAALRRYFAQVQSAQLQQGLLRQDGGGPDTPYEADDLARLCIVGIGRLYQCQQRFVADSHAVAGR